MNLKAMAEFRNLECSFLNTFPLSPVQTRHALSLTILFSEDFQSNFAIALVLWAKDQIF